MRAALVSNNFLLIALNLESIKTFESRSKSVTPVSIARMVAQFAQASKSRPAVTAAD